MPLNRNYFRALRRTNSTTNSTTSGGNSAQPRTSSSSSNANASHQQRQQQQQSSSSAQRPSNQPQPQQIKKQQQPPTNVTTTDPFLQPNSVQRRSSSSNSSALPAAAAAATAAAAQTTKKGPTRFMDLQKNRATGSGGSDGHMSTGFPLRDTVGSSYCPSYNTDDNNCDDDDIRREQELQQRINEDTGFTQTMMKNLDREPQGYEDRIPDAGTPVSNRSSGNGASSGGGGGHFMPNQLGQQQQQQQASGGRNNSNSNLSAMSALSVGTGLETKFHESNCGGPTKREQLWYGLPLIARNLFATRRKIKKLHDWQHTVLTREEVINGKNFVYSLPTSGGKTLVAEIILMRCIKERNQTGIFIVPFVALAEEKVAALEPFGAQLDFNVEGYHGNTGRTPVTKKVSLFVATPEKATSIVNSLIAEGRHQELGCVVVDELHMVGESGRGPKLEALLTKVRAGIDSCQIIGMSATVPNLPELAAWLDAGCYMGDYRPIPLKQHLVAGSTLAELVTVEEYNEHQRKRDEMVEAHKAWQGRQAYRNSMAIIEADKKLKEQQKQQLANNPSSSSSSSSSSLPSSVTTTTGGPVVPPNSAQTGSIMKAGQMIQQQQQKKLAEDSANSNNSDPEPPAPPPYIPQINNGGLERSTDPKQKVLLAVKSLADVVRGGGGRQDLHLQQAVVQKLTMECVTNDEGSVLIFCGSRMVTEKCAIDIALSQDRRLADMGRGRTARVVQQLEEASNGALKRKQQQQQQAQNNRGPRDMDLIDLVQCGVAYHHAGLNTELREIIERAFRNKDILVLTCTSTLAAGVNLPARRSIILGTKMGMTDIDTRTYLQMCGRAGRAGLDKYGESFLVQPDLACKTGNAPHIRLMLQPQAKVQSQLVAEQLGTTGDEEDENLVPGFAHALLDAASVGLASTKEALFQVAQSFLYYYTVAEQNEEELSLQFDSALKFLAKHGFIRPDDSESEEQQQQQHGDEERPAAEIKMEDEEELLPSLPAGGDHQSSLAAKSSTTSPQPLPAGGMGGNATTTTTTTMMMHTTTSNSNSSNRSSNTAVMSRVPSLPSAAVTRTASGIVIDADTAGEIKQEDRTGDDDDDAADLIPRRPRRMPYSGHVVPTPFGVSAGKVGFNLDQAILLKHELVALQANGLILSDDLHLCYFLTPISEIDSMTLDWGVYLSTWNTYLEEKHRRIGALIGIDVAYIEINATNCIKHLAKNAKPDVRLKWFKHVRFYCAIVLKAMLQEEEYDVVASLLDTEKQARLKEHASQFAFSITEFCRALEWHQLEAVLSSYVKRIGYGVKPDLVPLMELKSVSAPRARLLWNLGFKSIKDLASAEPSDIWNKVKAEGKRQSGNNKDNKVAKFFKDSTAVKIVREANAVLKEHIREKQRELIDLKDRGHDRPPMTLSDATQVSQYGGGGGGAGANSGRRF